MSGTRTAVRSGGAGEPPARSRGGPPPRSPREADPEVVSGRRRGRRAVWWGLAGVAVLVAAGAAAVWSPLLDVESVQVVGVTGSRAVAVKQAADVGEGDPILGFLPGRAAGRVRDLAWVDDARVVRDLPGAVRIEVVPRVPVGWTRAGDRVLVVAADGRVIDRVEAPPGGVPELVGVGDVAPVGGVITPASLPAAAAALGSELRARVTTVVLVDGAVTAQVLFGPELRFGTPDRIAVKARVAAAVLASLADARAGYVDVSVPAAPVSG